MPVTDDMVASFRAYLSGDREQWNRRMNAMDRSPKSERVYLAMLTAVFFEALARRFSDAPTRDETVEFVADLRSRGEQLAERLDPEAAERMIAAVYDHDVDLDGISQDQRLGVRMSVSRVIFYDEGPDSAELEEFLDKSRTFANEMLG